jgi:hypothetical protein
MPTTSKAPSSDSIRVRELKSTKKPLAPRLCGPCVVNAAVNTRLLSEPGVYKNVVRRAHALRRGRIAVLRKNRTAAVSPSIHQAMSTASKILSRHSGKM